MTTAAKSANIVTPVDMPPGAGSVRGARNPAALTVEQLANALGLPTQTVRQHVTDGAPVAADGTINLIHYAAWLNKRLRELEVGDGD